MRLKFGLILDRTSSIYLKVRLKNLISVIFLLWSLKICHINCLIGVYEKVYKERGTVCSHKDADDLLKDVRSELDQYMYVIDKNLQHTDDFIVCVKHFAFFFHAGENKLIRDSKL